MPEHEHEWYFPGPNGEKIPARIISVEVPLEFDNVIANLALKNERTLTPYDQIRESLRVGVWFLQDPKKGGAGGTGYVTDETGKVSMVVTSSGFDAAKTLYPNLPVTIIPDPLTQNPFTKRAP